MKILTGFPYYQQSPVDDWADTYNGWHNRATWNVALWFSSDESLYEAWKRSSAGHMDAGHYWTQWGARAFAKALWPKGKTPDGDLLSEVNWQEIADSWNESWDDHTPVMSTCR